MGSGSVFDILLSEFVKILGDENQPNGELTTYFRNESALGRFPIKL